VKQLQLREGRRDSPRPLIRPSATFSPSKSDGEKALDGRAALINFFNAFYFDDSLLV
jgi:hypothetical protein